MTFFCMGSGSSGNCYYLLEDGFGLVIDMGIGVRSFRKYFNDYGLKLSQVRAMLITHDHTDHIKGAGALSSELDLPVYAHDAVHDGMGRNPLMYKKVAPSLQHRYSSDATFTVGPFSVETCVVPHDASGNCGYLLRTAATSFCLLTDMGHVTSRMASFISRAEHVVIEANYDPVMLQSGPYPGRLKRRIRCGTGHSSNVETAMALAQHLSPRARHVWLCHLSAENNRPELALRTVGDALSAAGLVPELHVLRRTMPSEVVHL